MTCVVEKLVMIEELQANRSKFTFVMLRLSQTLLTVLEAQAG